MDAALARAFEDTWPAAEYADAGGFRVGRGLGAGGRVSSARAVGRWTKGDIPAVEAIHRRWRQQPMFRVPDTDDGLADALQDAGYRRETPTAIMQAPVAALTGQPIPYLTTFAIWPPLAIQRDIWAAGNIDPMRQAVMDRVPAQRPRSWAASTTAPQARPLRRSRAMWRWSMRSRCCPPSAAGDLPDG